MPTLKIYQADAFSSKVFQGNPAAVCPLSNWLSEDLMQKIASENNLSETAFFVPEKDGFYIRWFTPTTEVDLCGHATLAAAHILFNHENYTKKEIVFYCKAGILRVTKNDQLITLDFPSSKLTLSSIPYELSNAFGKTPLEYYRSEAFGMAVFGSEDDISEISPDFSILKKAKEKIIIITSKGKSADFVSRVFGPQVGIDEDPVTGSAHTRLIPYWSEKLNKKKLSAIQLSERKGYLQCEDLGERVLISGEAVTYLIGEIII
ncbi:MAG TPA: PhzF family phenazine biosynthesis protein [Cytophagaceae bacterium]|jgi:PhzF family phenazine biosynthesis protein|nr:PhzF family phenazine biosynthesis protein [Cytophagaceae bacterium]